MTDDMNAQLTAAGNEMSASFLAAKKRSDETLASSRRYRCKFTMPTGDRSHRPSASRPRLRLHPRAVSHAEISAGEHEYHHRDYQVITDRDTTEHIDDNVLNYVLDYMAAGIDPRRRR